MKLCLRRATKEDMDLLFRWANDAMVRQNAFHTEQIPYENHVRWFEKVMTDASVQQYILCDGEIPVGQIRLNIEGGVALIDYSVCTERRGEGCGSIMLGLIREQVQKTTDITRLIGQVKYENTASARVFEKCGYHKKEMPEYIQYEICLLPLTDQSRGESEKWRINMRIIIATIKSWNIERALALQEQYKGIHEIVIYTGKEEFNINNVRNFNPDYIFLPHWSYIMPGEICDHWECVVFHMTDLPYGRGGSPLQNLIVRGHKETKISAIRMTQQLDGGPVYMKHSLTLEGSAQEIFVRCSDIIFHEMIPAFLAKKITPVPQEGEPVVFKRRKPEEGRIMPDMTLDKIYDYIRMLDAEGYPRAYMQFGDYRLSFEEASFTKQGEVLEAKVTFTRMEDMRDEDSLGGGGTS